MAFTRITAAEAAALIKNGDNIGLSGFTPAGTPKAVTAEVAKIAHAEHEAGRPFQILIYFFIKLLCEGKLMKIYPENKFNYTEYIEIWKNTTNVAKVSF